MKILILRVSAIGDVIHTFPAVFYLIHYCPNVQISWLVQKKAADLISTQPFLKEVLILPDKFLHPKNFLKTVKIIKKLRQTHWDVIIDFQGIQKTGIFLSLLKGEKFGFCKKQVRSSFNTLFINKQIQTEYKNIIQKNLALVNGVIQEVLNPNECITIQELKKYFVYKFNEREKTAVDIWLNLHKIDKFILLCPNTTRASKHWPEKFWFEIMTKLINKKIPFKMLLVGQNFGNAAKNLATLCQQQRLPIFMVPKWNLNAIAYLISKAKLLIAPDTGLLHLADFLNINSIGIFGPTSKDLQGPFLKNANIKNAIQVFNDMKEADFKKTTPSENAMYNLKPDMLLEKILKILKLEI